MFIHCRGDKSYCKYESRKGNDGGKVPSYGRRPVDEHIDIHSEDSLIASLEETTKLLVSAQNIPTQLSMVGR